MYHFVKVLFLAVMVATLASVVNVISHQRAFWGSGSTRDLDFRLQALRRLRQGIVAYQGAILAAVRADLGRPPFEGYFEIGAILELDHIIAHLPQWVRSRRVPVPLNQQPGSAWIQPEPLGVVLILGPWNYPLQLMLSPLFGAIAAGNCAILKPSELAPATSQVLATLTAEVFDPNHVTVVEGGVDTAQALLAEQFDHIFFTGGERVGRIVMQAAAAHLTPVTLELGGKSPCILDTDVNLEVAIRRIVWGKFLNAGQTCVAPDYLLVPSAMATEVTQKLKERLQTCFGTNPQHSPDYARIINHQQFDRLLALLDSGRILWGGSHDREQRFIAPTLMDGVDWQSPMMEAEIFGPILPILTYTDLDEVIAQVTRRPKPLAFYLFSRSPKIQERLLRQISAGSVCLNDVILQVSLWDLPFGGVGSSGMGRYHGRYSFETFSHLKSVLKKPFWLDMDWRYPPYAQKISLFRRFIGLR